MAQTVVGMFKYPERVESAVKELQGLGYDPKEFSVVMKDVQKMEEVAGDTGVSVAEGTKAGAVTGGLLGGLTGLLVGLGVVTLPAIGALLVAGPIAAALGLTGAAATTTTGAVAGVVGGGLVGALASYGFPQEEAAQFEEYIHGGGILLIVPTRDERSQEVRDILAKHEATDVRQLDLHST